MLKLPMVAKVRLINALLYCVLFALWLFATLFLRDLLIPGRFNDVFVLEGASSSLALLLLYCWWAGDFLRRFALLALSIAFAAMLATGGTILTAVALTNWRLLFGSLSLEAGSLLIASAGCLYLAKRIKVATKIIA